MTGTCEDCAYNVYDDEMDEYVCEAYLDEDEFYRVQTRGRNHHHPFLALPALRSGLRKH